jgi:hypothetical protein
MRYKLTVDGFTRTPVYAKSKKEIEAWIDTNTQEKGFEWRVGYMVKFHGDKKVYEWVMADTGNKIKT